MSTTNQTRRRRGAALLVDVVDSSTIAGFREGRDGRLRRLSGAHLDQDWIAAPYTVTAWDEFQSVAWDPPDIPAVLLDLRRVFAPWELYIAIGLGELSPWVAGEPINVSVSGPGFERARAAMDVLKAARGDKYRRLTRFQSGDVERDSMLNLVYGLHDTLVQQVTARQWETISTAMEVENQEEVAARMDVQPSTVTRNLKRGHYWQMRDTASKVAGMLRGDEMTAAAEKNG